MTVTVEDGTGVTDANSYISQDTWEAYAEARNWDFSDYNDAEKEAAILAAALYLDTRYASQFPGVQTDEGSQSMQWPRKAGSIVDGVFYEAYPATVMSAAGWPIANDAIPDAIIQAQCEATWRELQDPGVLAPDLERGGGIKSLKAGSVALEYNGNAPMTTTFTVIDRIMSAILTASSQMPSFLAQASRA